MRDNTTIYRLLSLDGEVLLTGNAREVCMYTGLSSTNVVNRYVEHNSICFKKYKIEIVGIYRRIFALYKDDEQVFIGTLDDISNKYYVGKNSVKLHAGKGTLLLGEYQVEELEGKVESYVDY